MVCVLRPMSVVGPTMALASEGGMSVCPRCTPWAPTSAATAGWSFRMNTASCRLAAHKLAGGVGYL